MPDSAFAGQSDRALPGEDVTEDQIAWHDGEDPLTADLIGTDRIFMKDAAAKRFNAYLTVAFACLREHLTPFKRHDLLNWDRSVSAAYGTTNERFFECDLQIGAMSVQFGRSRVLIKHGVEAGCDAALFIQIREWYLDR